MRGKIKKHTNPSELPYQQRIRPENIYLAEDGSPFFLVKEQRYQRVQKYFETQSISLKFKKIGMHSSLLIPQDKYEGIRQVYGLPEYKALLPFETENSEDKSSSSSSTLNNLSSSSHSSSSGSSSSTSISTTPAILRSPQITQHNVRRWSNGQVSLLFMYQQRLLEAVDYFRQYLQLEPDAFHQSSTGLFVIQFSVAVYEKIRALHELPAYEVLPDESQPYSIPKCSLLTKVNTQRFQADKGGVFPGFVFSKESQLLVHTVFQYLIEHFIEDRRTIKILEHKDCFILLMLKQDYDQLKPLYGLPDFHNLKLNFLQTTPSTGSAVGSDPSIGSSSASSLGSSSTPSLSVVPCLLITPFNINLFSEEKFPAFWFHDEKDYQQVLKYLNFYHLISAPPLYVIQNGIHLMVIKREEYNQIKEFYTQFKEYYNNIGNPRGCILPAYAVLEPTSQELKEHLMKKATSTHPTIVTPPKRSTLPQLQLSQSASSVTSTSSSIAKIPASNSKPRDKKIEFPPPSSSLSLWSDSSSSSSSSFQAASTSRQDKKMEFSSSRSSSSLWSSSNFSNVPATSTLKFESKKEEGNSQDRLRELVRPDRVCLQAQITDGKEYFHVVFPDREKAKLADELFLKFNIYEKSSIWQATQKYERTDGVEEIGVFPAGSWFLEVKLENYKQLRSLCDKLPEKLQTYEHIQKYHCKKCFEPLKLSSNRAGSFASSASNSKGRAIDEKSYDPKLLSELRAVMAKGSVFLGAYQNSTTGDEFAQVIFKQKEEAEDAASLLWSLRLASQKIPNVWTSEQRALERGKPIPQSMAGSNPYPQVEFPQATPYFRIHKTDYHQIAKLCELPPYGSLVPYKRIEVEPCAVCYGK